MLELLEGELYEWSPVLVGANSETATISVKDAAAGPEVKTKSQYFGNYMEPRMTLAALSELNSCLFYYVIWDTLYDAETPISERLDFLRGAFAEFGDIALKVISGIMATSTESTDGESFEVATKALRELWPDPKDTDNSSFNSPAGLKFFQRCEAALAAVDKLGADAQGIHNLRQKDNRSISGYSRQQLQHLATEMKSRAANLEAMLAETDPQREEKANALALRLRSIAIAEAEAGLLS